jgi:hypothetical protein
MMKRHWKGFWSVALPLASWIAIYSPAAGAQTVIREPADPADWRPRSVFGNAVLLGGGFGNFTGEYARDVTGPVGAWGLKYVAGTRSIIGGELAYVGGINSLDGTPSDDDYLLGSSFDANIRAALPFPLHSALVSPFVFAGGGWTRYDLVNEEPDFGVLTSSTDNQFTIPMGAGVMGGYRGFIGELRAVYRQAFDEELFNDQDMSTWGVSLSLGGEF